MLQQARVRKYSRRLGEKESHGRETEYLVTRAVQK
jgi:hypothetical protein